MYSIILLVPRPPDLTSFSLTGHHRPVHARHTEEVELLARCMRHFDSDGVVLPEAADLGEMIIKVRGLGEPVVRLDRHVERLVLRAPDPSYPSE